MSDVLKNILDLGVKYGPEVAQYFSGQKRISDQIERERRMEMPELQKMSAGTDVQFLLNQLNKDLTAPAREQLGADYKAAEQAAIKTKGAKGIGSLANLLRSKGAAEAKLLQAGETAKTGIAAKTAPLTQAIQRYNIGVDDQGALFDFFKDQRIGALEDQSQRMKGRGSRTLFDIIGDSRGLLSGLKSEEEEDDNTAEGEGMGTQKEELIDNRQPASQEKILEMIKSGEIDLEGIQEIDQPEEDLDAEELAESVNNLARGRGPLSFVNLSRSQTGPRAANIASDTSLVGLGGPASFDFSDPRARALFNLLRQ